MEINENAYQIYETCNSIIEAEKYIVKGYSVLHIQLQGQSCLEDSSVDDDERCFIFENQKAGGSGYIFSFSEGTFKQCEYSENYLRYIKSPQLNDPLSGNLVMYIIQEIRFNSGSACIHLAPMIATLMNYLISKHQEYLQFENDKIPGITPFRIKQIEQHIKNRIDSCITTSELAQLCGLSQYHFIRMFKRTTGQTPHQYINRLKMEKAKELLGSENKSIIQVGFATGFDNPSHFTQVFKSIVGITPLKFRKGMLLY